MNGKTLPDFIDELYCNPEMEIEYHSARYSVSGYLDESKEFVLRVDSIENQSSEVFL